MACLRCGSHWKTKKGKDKVSCPECCKQQRCKARKQGRLPASETKACERCGQAFEAVGGNAIARSTKCQTCVAHDASSGARQKRWRQRVKAGIKIRGERVTSCEVRHCGWCDKKLDGANEHKYCSKRCFADARKAGKQSWDRTNQLESVWHRSGRWACAPSRKPVQEMRTNLTAFLSKIARLYLRVSARHKACEVCGSDCYGPKARFCSMKCLSESERQEPCYKCGKVCRIKGVARKAMCVDCRQLSKNRTRKKYGKNFRRRAKYHGVQYIAFPVRDIHERDGYRCQICRERVFNKARYRKSDGKIHPMSPTIDHIVPMCRGGNHEPSNCQTACFRCNSRKSGVGGGQLRLAIEPTALV